MPKTSGVGEQEEAGGTVELVGTIEPAPWPWVVADLKLQPEGDDMPAVERWVREPFVLRTERGAVRVDSAGASMTDAPRVLRSARWRELEESGIGAVAGGFAPGPHVRVTVAGAGFAPGERVRVVGTPTRTTFGPGDYRAAPDVEPLEIRAASIIGTEAPRRTGAARRWHEEVGAFVGTALAAAMSVGVLVLPSPAAWGDALARGSWLAFASYLGWRSIQHWVGCLHVRASSPARYAIPELRPLGEAGKRASDFPFIFASVAIFLLALLPKHVAAAAGVMKGNVAEVVQASSSYFVVACLTAALPIGLSCLEWWKTRASRRAARALLRAPRRRGLEGGWRAVEGAAAENVVARVVEVTFTSTGVGRGARPEVHIRETTAGRSLEVRTADDDVLRISLAGATVGTSDCEVERKTVDGARVLALRSHVRMNDSVLVAGRFAEGARNVSPQGPESLLVFATSGRGSARAVLARRYAAQHLPWLLVGAALLYGVGLALFSS